MNKRFAIQLASAAVDYARSATTAATGEYYGLVENNAWESLARAAVAYAKAVAKSEAKP